MSRLIGVLNTGTALVADVTGRGAELIRGVASAGASALLCRVGADSESRRIAEQVSLGCEGVPWGVMPDPAPGLDERTFLDLIGTGADFVVMPCDTFPAWGLDVLESFPKVGRLVAVAHDMSGDEVQALETLGPQAIAVQIDTPELTIGTLGSARIIVESVALRVLAWMPNLGPRDSRLLRQIGAAGFIVSAGTDDPDRVVARVSELAEALAEPVQLRTPLG